MKTVSFNPNDKAASMSKPTLTPEMVKMSKNVVCSCGGMLFRQAMVFKKISAIISPTGKEELMPIDVIVCEKCNLVNRELTLHDILPDEIMEKRDFTDTLVK